ncbi:MAG: peptide-methionine (S)-S-oxide reductase MsrA [Culicoidibacterales bacterium]
MKKIWVAGGCFWGVEAYFQQLEGVLLTSVGYAQGNTVNPTYAEVCTGSTYHTETVEIIYDEEIINLQKIMEHTFRFIDPTSLNKQGGDSGPQYRTGIYYVVDSEKEEIKAFIAKMQLNFKDKIVVEVEPLKNFYLAEGDHQSYLERNPRGYCHINLNLVLPNEMKKRGND